MSVKEWPAWRYRHDSDGKLVSVVFESASAFAADPHKDWSDHPAKIGKTGAELAAAVSPPAAPAAGEPGHVPKKWPGWRYRRAEDGTTEGRQFESAAELAADKSTGWVEHPDGVTAPTPTPTPTPAPVPIGKPAVGGKPLDNIMS